MKKFFILFAALLFSFAVSAQTIENPKFFENWEVAVEGGAITTTHLEGEPFFWTGLENVWNGIRPVAGIEITKYVTPVVGFGLEGLTMFNTIGSNTFVDQHNIVGNVKFNLSNWFGGYKGEPRRVEVVFVPGLGWGHNYGDTELKRNFSTYNLGTELNINLGKARAHQIRIKPAAVWDNYTEDVNVLRPTTATFQVRATVGYVYKFGSKAKKSHNFVACPHIYTAAEYDSLQKELDALKAAGPVIKEVEVIKEVPVEKVVRDVEVRYVPLTVTFPIGSSKLSEIEQEKVLEFVSVLDLETNIIVEGSADSGTGSAKRNADLSEQRADAVASLLREKGFKNVATQTQLDSKGDKAYSRAAIISIAE